MSPSSPKFRLPQLNPLMAQAIKDYWQVQERHQDEINAKVNDLAMAIPDFAPVIKGMSKELQAKQQAEGQERSRRAIMDGDWEPYMRDLSVQGEHYAKMGISFHAWLDLIRMYKDVMSPIIRADLKDDAKMRSAVDGMHELLYLAIEGIGEAYLGAKEHVIRGQEEAIRELSTPVLKVRDRLLIIPVIGIMDTQRARQVTESMLHAIRDHRARTVVMDITGVPMVDSKVANHLIQSVEAARLMGATVIITGLSPEIAQTLVALGADLPDVKTYGDLQGGIEEAERIMGLEVKAMARRLAPAASADGEA
jgi:rsbT co-antagonist protein RsbR